MLYKQIFFTNLLAQAQTSLSCKLSTNLFLSLNGKKASCFSHFEPLGLPYIQNKNCLSPINLLYVSLIIRASKEPRGEEGNIFLPLHSALSLTLSHLQYVSNFFHENVVFLVLNSLKFLFSTFLSLNKYGLLNKYKYLLKQCTIVASIDK